MTHFGGGHTVKAFAGEFEFLTGEVSRMGGLAESLVSDAIDALVTRDVALADSVVERDQQIDQLQRDIERHILKLLALRQPLAGDLRATVSALKIINDLERVGDLAKSSARRVKPLAEIEPTQYTKSVERMGRLVQGHLNQVLNAYATGRVEQAVGVWARDDDVDEHYAALFRQLLTFMAEDKRLIGPGTHLLFVAKNLERIGDHATNIAEVVHFLVTGDELMRERPRGPRPELDAT